LFWEENKVENKVCAGAFSILRRHSRAGGNLLPSGYPSAVGVGGGSRLRGNDGAGCASQPYFQPYFSSQNNLSSKWFRMIFLNLITLFFCHRFRRVRNVLVGY
jgi:hypothetical protein